jgi:predicted Zn finger-like uncharacterized protein
MTITVSCPSCDTSFPVDPAKIPPEGVRAQCSNCPEIFDVDGPSEAIPEAPPVTESTIETIGASDPLESALVDPPPLEDSVEGADSTAIGGEPTHGDTSEIEDFGAIDMAIEPPDTAEAGAELVEADATPVSAPPPSTAEPAQAEEPPATVSGGPPESPGAPGAIRFGRRNAEDKAKSLARSLVSDLIAYNPEKHKEALAAGTLQEVFSEEIDKSLKEYQEQVDPEVMAQGTFFNDALNSVLAEERSVFTLDD